MKKDEMKSYTHRFFIPCETSDEKNTAKKRIKGYWTIEIIEAIIYSCIGTVLVLASGFINRDIVIIGRTEAIIIAYAAVLFILTMTFLFLVSKTARLRITILIYTYNRLIRERFLSQDAVTFDFRRAPILFLKYLIDECNYVEGKSKNGNALTSTNDMNFKKKWGLEATGIISIITILFNPRGEKDGPSLFDRLVAFTSPVFSRNSELFLRALLLLLGIGILILVTNRTSKKIPPLLRRQPEYDLVSLSSVFAKQELDRRISEMYKSEENPVLLSNECETRGHGNIHTVFKKICNIMKS